MRQINRFCAALVMLLALSLTAFAGHMPCGVDDPPPPPPTTVSTVETESGAVEAVAIALLEDVLSLL